MGISASPADSNGSVRGRGMHRPFPTHDHAPLHQDFPDALDFATSNGDRASSEFRDRQLIRPGVLSGRFEGVTAERYSDFPAIVRPGTGTLRAARCAMLSEIVGANSADSVIQFALGFPLTGTLSRRFTLPLCDVILPPAVDPDAQLDSKNARFESWEWAAPVKRAAALWKEAMGQADAGGLIPPALRNINGNFPEGPSRDCNVARRF